VQEYMRFVWHKIADAAQFALDDLKPAKMGFGIGEAPNVAFVRRFRMKDGSIRTNPGVDNPDIDTSFRIKFESDRPFLDRIMEWQNFNTDDYVLGLEPASCSLTGKLTAVEDGSQKYLEGGGSIVNKVTVAFSDCISK